MDIKKHLLTNPIINDANNNGDVFWGRTRTIPRPNGNMAYKMPSINKNRPKAMINSFIKWLFCFWLYISEKFKKFTIRR